MSECTFRSKPRLRLSYRGKSLVSGVTARVAPTLSNSSFEGAQLSGAERTPAVPEKTQDERSVAPQLLGGVETAVGVWQEEMWRGVSDLQRVRCHICVAQPPHEVAV